MNINPNLIIMSENIYIVNCVLVIAEKAETEQSEQTFNTTSFSKKIIKISSSEEACIFLRDIKSKENSVNIPDLIFINECFLKDENILKLLQEVEEELFVFPKIVVLSEDKTSKPKEASNLKGFIKTVKKQITPQDLFSDDLLQKVNS